MLLARRGSLITITSVVATRGGRGVSIYASSKAALETLTRSVAIEMAPKGIRVNAVAPGVIVTKMSERLRSRRGDRLLQRVPMGRVGEPADLAPTILLLASDRASPYTTGQVFVVDGGLSL
jgi:3-oxoacyl-[acyl-carrier protein] reductase